MIDMIADVFEAVKNRNEERVQTILMDVIKEYADKEPTCQDLRDIYACALNKLPARYAQTESKVYYEPVSDESIRDAVVGAVITVLIRPRSDR